MKSPEQTKKNEEKRLSILQTIIDTIDLEKGSRILSSNFSEGTQIKQGQFIFALHPFASVMLCVGYAVQVRKKAGSFNSDLILIRLANGSLQAWDNQAFFNMSKEQEMLARQVFVDLPENEDYSQGYSTHDKIREVGFLVEDSKSTPPPSSHPNVNITLKDGDTIQHISFI
jgi:hypothetical protein